MSDKIVTVKTIGIKDHFGSEKNGICDISVNIQDCLDVIGVLIEQKKDIFVKYEDMDIATYVADNYENISTREKDELEEKFNVTIGYYSCKDND